MHKILDNIYITNVKTKSFRVYECKITNAQTNEFHNKARGNMRDVVMRFFCAYRLEMSWRSEFSRKFRNRRQPRRCSEKNDKTDRGRIWYKEKLAPKQ